MPLNPTSEQRLDDMAQEVVRITDTFCYLHLTGEYLNRCRDLAAVVRDDYPHLLGSGRAKSWAAAVVYTIARVNSLFQSRDGIHMSATDLCRELEVSHGNVRAKSSQIMDAVESATTEPAWHLSDLILTDQLDAIAAFLEDSLESEGAASLRPEATETSYTARTMGPIDQSAFHVVGGPPTSSGSAAAQHESEFSGIWHITEMSEWDDRHVETENHAYIRIEPNGMGMFRFGLIAGGIDGKIVEYADFTRFEFTWGGVDEDHPVFGSGWIQRQEYPTFHGEIRMHLSDDSHFLAEKQPVGQWHTSSTTKIELRETPRSVYQIKVTLRSIKPPIWRRILVPDDTPLNALHGMLQAVMGWTGAHQHQFELHGTRDGTPHTEFGFEINPKDEERTRLNQVLVDTGSWIIYEYDFGACWEHVLLLEDVLPWEEEDHYPRCIKGRRASPLEVCGGPEGYGELLQALQDPEHPEHRSLLAWAGGQVDSEAFDLDESNRRLDNYVKRVATERRWDGR